MYDEKEKEKDLDQVQDENQSRENLPLEKSDNKPRRRCGNCEDMKKQLLVDKLSLMSKCLDHEQKRNMAMFDLLDRVTSGWIGEKPKG